jgi:hypothetical protein
MRATRSGTALDPLAAPLTLVIASPGLSIDRAWVGNSRLPDQEMASASGRSWLAGETCVHDLLYRTRSRPGGRRQPKAGILDLEAIQELGNVMGHVRFRDRTVGDEDLAQSVAESWDRLAVKLALAMMDLDATDGEVGHMLGNYGHFARRGRLPIDVVADELSAESVKRLRRIVKDWSSLDRGAYYLYSWHCPRSSRHLGTGEGALI